MPSSNLKPSTPKIFLTANEVLLGSFKLARMILDSNWVPDVMIALWRGGAPVGIAVHEFLYYHGLRPRHHVIKCYSYHGIKSRSGEVCFEHANEFLDSIEPGAKLLVIDDVFDTGATARAVQQRLAPVRSDLRLATLYWKPGQNLTDIQPDFHLFETEEWIVFPHEMDGLTSAEIKLKDPQLFNLLGSDLLLQRTTK